jgi:hypothetical protein
MLLCREKEHKRPRHLSTPTNNVCLHSQWLSTRILITAQRPRLLLYKLPNGLPIFFPSWTSRPLKVGPIRCPEMSVNN